MHRNKRMEYFPDIVSFESLEAFKLLHMLT